MRRISDPDWPAEIREPKRRQRVRTTNLSALPLDVRNEYLANTRKGKLSSHDVINQTIVSFGAARELSDAAEATKRSAEQVLPNSLGGCVSLPDAPFSEWEPDTVWSE